MRINTHSFIVRIWFEAVDEEGNASTWRGSIEHVSSGRRLHFDRFDEILNFVREQSGLKETRPARWWRMFLGLIRP